MGSDHMGCDQIVEIKLDGRLPDVVVRSRCVVKALLLVVANILFRCAAG